MDIKQIHEKLIFSSCKSGDYLLERIVTHYTKHFSGVNDIICLPHIDKEFADGEIKVKLEQSIKNADVFLVQCLYNPKSNFILEKNIMSFLISARALKEYGAQHIIGVLPYLAYSRQDKSNRDRGEPCTAKLIAELVAVTGVDGIITWDPHSSWVIRKYYNNVLFKVLTPVKLFIEKYHQFKDRNDVIVVAPDFGAESVVKELAQILHLDYAIARKNRPNPDHAIITEIIGNFNNHKVAIVLDDMISTGGTLFACVKKLVEDYNINEIYVGVSHNLCINEAFERLLTLRNNYNLKDVFVTNSIPQTDEFKKASFISEYCLAETFSQVINQIYTSHISNNK